MSFSDNYWALKNKQTTTTNNQTTKKKKKDEEESSSFSDNYWALKEQNDVAPDDIAPTVGTLTAGDVTKGIAKGILTGLEVAPTAMKVAGKVASNTKPKWYQGYVDKGAFSDGYQFGDVHKAVFGTLRDVEDNVNTAILTATENLIDTTAYGIGWVGDKISPGWAERNNFDDFIAKDFLHKEELGKKLSYSNPVSALSEIAGVDAETDSVLAEKGEGLVQSGAHLVGSAALQKLGVPAWLTMGVNAFGGELEEAFNNDATYGEAGTSALISAGVEVLSEKIFGGIVSKTGLDDAIAKPIAGKISNKLVRGLLKGGTKIAGEGAEEVLSDVGTKFGRAITYDDRDWREIFASEEATDDYINSFLSGAILGAGGQGVEGISAKAHGVDYTTGLTADEETVVKKIYDERLAEAEKKGRVSLRDKNKIWDEIVEEMSKGDISTDTIEEVLGGETYKSYQDSVSKEESVLKEFEDLYEAEELEQQRSDFLANSESNKLKTQLGNEVYDRVKNTRLGESYREIARRHQKFDADVSKYDEKQRQVIQKAIDSGILNNRRRTHDFVDMIAKLSADTGRSFDFTNNERLKDSGFAVDGKIVNGYVTDDGITLNIQSPKALNTTVGHEVTHVLEGTDLYEPLQQIIEQYARGRKASDSKFANEYMERLYNARQLYKSVEGYSGVDGHNKIKREVVADLVGDYLFTDENFIQHLTTNRNLFQKLYDEIKYLCKIATAGSQEAKDLERVKKAFENAYKATGKTDSKAESGTKYSISDNSGKELSKGQQEYFKDSKARDGNGNLVKVYHSSPTAGFSVFDGSEGHGNYKYGDYGDSIAFFTDSKEMADSYSPSNEKVDTTKLNNVDEAKAWLDGLGFTDFEIRENNGEYELIDPDEELVYTFDDETDLLRNLKRTVQEEYGDVNAGGQYGGYVNIKSPLVVDAEGRPWDRITEEFSQEIYDKFQSLTAEEKAALHDLAGWEDASLFVREIRSALTSEGDDFTQNLASAFNKLKDDTGYVNLFNLYDIATDNFTEESIRESATVTLSTNDYVERALQDGSYDGVIIKNVIDYGGHAHSTFASPPGTDYIVFNSNQFKAADNLNPTEDADIRYSLSAEGETPKAYGDYRISGEDVAYEEIAPVNAKTEQNVPIAENVATETAEEMFPDEMTEDDEFDSLDKRRADLETQMLDAMNGENPDVDTFYKLNAEYEQVKQRMTDLAESIAMRDAGRFDSLDDADAPPIVEQYDDSPIEGVTLTKVAEDAVARAVRNHLGVTNPNKMGAVREIIREYAQNENPNRDELANALRDKFGTYEETTTTEEEIKDAKKFLRRQAMFVPDSVKKDIPDFLTDFKKRNKFKLLFRDDARMGIDELYGELNGKWPDLFPLTSRTEDVETQTGQLLRMEYVANMTGAITETRHIDDAAIYETADEIINAVGDYRNAQREKSSRPGKGYFDSLMREADLYDDIAPSATENVAENIAPAVEATEDVAPVKETPKQGEAHRAQILFGKDKSQPKKNKLWNWVKEHIFSHGAVFEDLALKTGNRELIARFDNIRRAESRAQNFIGKGNNEAKALLDIRKEVVKSGKLEPFNYYLYHLHNVDRMTLEERFKDTPNKAVFGDVSAEDSRKSAAFLEAQNPEFKQWAEDIYGINKYLRKMLVENGVISQETANLWEKMYPHYVPIGRVGHNGSNVNVPLDSKKTGVNAPIKRATGGNSDMYDLFDVMGGRIEQTYKAVANERFGVELKNTLRTTIESESAGDIDTILDSIDQYEELLQAGKDGQSPTFTVFENGERVKFAITEEMYDAMKPSNYTGTIGWLNKLNNFRRDVLTTFSPTFAVTNPIKDIGDILVNSQHPLRTYAEVPEAIWQMATKGKYHQERIEQGGSQDTYFDSQSKLYKEKSTFSKVVGFPFECIRRANEAIEQVPRLAEYIASRKMGRSVDVSMLDAARVTTNFGAAGDFTNMLNRNGATFLSASVEGFNQQVRNIREAKVEGLKGWAKLAGKYLIAGLPALLLNHMLWDDDEEYEELSDYVKQNYYIVGKMEDGTFVRIPKGRAVAVIQDAFVQMENLITGNDDVDLESFANLVKTNIAPNNVFDNWIGAPIVDAIQNKAWYGGDLVPSRLQDLPAEEQYDESTDSISKWLGEKTGTSPYKWNYILDQYSGGAGDMVLPYLTPEADGGGVGAAFKDKFTTSSVFNNQNVSDFYDKVDELQVNANSYSATDEDILMSKYMNGVNSELSELYKEKREIQNSDMSDSRKQRKLREVQEEINELMEDALNTYEDIDYEDGYREGGNYARVGDFVFKYDEENETWDKLSKEQLTKYEVTKAAGNANYATDGENHYMWYVPEDSTKESYWKKITDEQLEKQEEVTRGLGITPETYWSNKDEYDYAYKYPENYAVAKAVGGYDSYKSYSSDLYDIHADKDSNGKSISGSRKTKVLDYINNMDADYHTKIILWKSEYPSDDTYNAEIVDYLNSRDDISYEEMETILKELGFTVKADGTIYW